MEKQSDSQVLTLNQNYTFYFQSVKDKDKTNFVDQIQKIGTFNTAQEFWTYYQHMVRPSQLPEETKIYLFSENIKPLWEDEENKNGGRYVLRIKKKYSNRFWEDLLLSFIGQQCPEHKYLAGLNLCIKDQFIIIWVWVLDFQKNKDVDNNIKKWILKTLNLSDSTTIEFKEHPTNESKKQEEQIKDIDQKIYSKNQMQPKQKPAEINKVKEEQKVTNSNDATQPNQKQEDAKVSSEKQNKEPVQPAQQQPQQQQQQLQQQQPQPEKQSAEQIQDKSKDSNDTKKQNYQPQGRDKYQNNRQNNNTNSKKSYQN